MNKVILLGRLTRDPEQKTTPGGSVLANFRIAVSRSYKNTNGEYEADFLNCVAWRHTAEFISKHFKKGDMISLCGRIQTRSYEDPDGTKHYVTEIVAEEAGFGGVKKTEQAEMQDGTPEGVETVPEDDKLPF